MVNLNNFTPEDLIALVSDSKRRKEFTDDDWLAIGDWISENITKEKVSPEVYKKFWPLGIGEIVGMICDGIDRRTKN